MMLGFDFWAAAEASAVLFGIFGLILVFLARDIDRWPARLCIAILSSALLSAALALLKRATTQNQVSHSLFRALLCAEALITPLPSLLVFAYFLHCCGENYFRLCLLPLGCCDNWTIQDIAGHIFQPMLPPYFKPLLKGGKEFVF